MLKKVHCSETLFLVYFKSAPGRTLTQNMNDFRAFLRIFGTVFNSKIKKRKPSLSSDNNFAPQRGCYITVYFATAASQNRGFIMILFHDCSMIKDKGNKKLLFLSSCIIFVFLLRERLEVLIPLCWCRCCKIHRYATSLPADTMGIGALQKIVLLIGSSHKWYSEWTLRYQRHAERRTPRC